MLSNASTRPVDDPPTSIVTVVAPDEETDGEGVTDSVGVGDGVSETDGDPPAMPLGLGENCA
jgi:hypothetical protein